MAKLICHNCGLRLDPGDTTIIKMAQPRFEERKHCCPNCSAVIAIEIGPNEDATAADKNRAGPDDI
jgi:RNase P subunit RPR2